MERFTTADNFGRGAVSSQFSKKYIDSCPQPDSLSSSMRISRLLISVTLLLSPIMLMAQNAPFRGRISDSSGAVIPGSKVKVLRGRDVIAEATTNATGDFDLELAAGEYQIE